MNLLAEEILVKIYRHKHELEFKPFLDELVDNKNDFCYFSSRKI